MGLLMEYAQDQVWTELVAATGRAPRRKRRMEAEGGQHAAWGDNEDDTVSVIFLGGSGPRGVGDECITSD